MARIFDERLPSIEALKSAPVYFRYTQPKTRRVLVDMLTANAVLAVYNGLSKQEHKDKLARMVAGTPAQLNRIVDFAWKHVSL